MRRSLPLVLIACLGLALILFAYAAYRFACPPVSRSMAVRLAVDSAHGYQVRTRLMTLQDYYAGDTTGGSGNLGPGSQPV